MGLDNGIMLCGKHPQLIVPNPPFDWSESDTEICYWRKFWGFRNEVVKTLGQPHECDDIWLNIDKLLIIIKILEKYLDRDYFETNADSIWTYEEYLVPIIKNIHNLKVTIEYIKLHPETKCYFYDSY